MLICGRFLHLPLISRILIQEIRFRFASSVAQDTVGNPLLPSLRVVPSLLSGFWCRFCSQNPCAICLVPQHLAHRSTARLSSHFAQSLRFRDSPDSEQFLALILGDFPAVLRLQLLSSLISCLFFLCFVCWCGRTLSKVPSPSGRQRDSRAFWPPTLPSTGRGGERASALPLVIGG